MGIPISAVVFRSDAGFLQLVSSRNSFLAPTVDGGSDLVLHALFGNCRLSP
jgi:hypothetical protein